MRKLSTDGFYRWFCYNRDSSFIKGNLYRIGSLRGALFGYGIFDRIELVDLYTSKCITKCTTQWGSGKPIRFGGTWNDILCDDFILTIPTVADFDSIAETLKFIDKSIPKEYIEKYEAYKATYVDTLIRLQKDTQAYKIQPVLDFFANLNETNKTKI